MRAHKIVDRIFQVEVALQVRFLLGVRQLLRTSRPLLWRDVKLSRSTYEVLIRGPQRSVCQNLDDIVCRTKQDMTFDFHHASPHAPLVDLGIAQVRIHHAFGFFAQGGLDRGCEGAVRACCSWQSARPHTPEADHW